MIQNDLRDNERNEATQDEILSAVLQKLGGIGGGAPPQNQGSSASATTNAASGDILSSLLSNPELIAKLPAIISSIKPIIDMLGKSAAQQNDSVAVAALPVDNAPSLPASRITQGSESRTALLCAMKPYLSEDRRNAIDYIVKLGRLGDILKTL